MSEMQYYEFRAIDRPLDSNERAALRQISSRAEITSTSLINVYHFGNFKGDPDKLMAQYFDAHLYSANWGSRTIMLRLPLTGLTKAEVEPYLPEWREDFSVKETKEHLVLTFERRNEGGDYDDYDDEDSPGSLGEILPVRNELLNGDYRALYLGWLLAAQQSFEDYEDDEDEDDEDEDDEDEDDEDPEKGEDPRLEPPVPPGLNSLTPAQRALVNFLEIDPELLAAAAEGSLDLSKTASPDQEKALAAWVKARPAGEKDALLLRLLRGEGVAASMELQRQFRDDQARKKPKGGEQSADTPRRSIGQLKALAKDLTQRRRESEKKKSERQRQERERKEAEAREKHLATLAGKETTFWQNVESLIASKLPKKYDEAVKILLDLRDLAARAGTQAEFTVKLTQLRKQQGSKWTLIDRLNRAGLS